jgi:hypothetical protein
VQQRTLDDLEAGKPVSADYIERRIKQAKDDEVAARRRAFASLPQGMAVDLGRPDSAPTRVQPPTPDPVNRATLAKLSETSEERAGGADRPPPKSRKPTEAQVARQKGEARLAHNQAEACRIFRKLDLSDIEQLVEIDTDFSWITRFEASEAWLWLSLEFDPNPPAESDPDEVLEYYGLNPTPENRQQLEQIRARKS